ncbi:MAG: DUF1425 domain-containing protein [Planctomycetes bacterium]|nr:DUF1425 domain-containing protein [Planctomycetota bacterium]
MISQRIAVSLPAILIALACATGKSVPTSRAGSFDGLVGDVSLVAALDLRSIQASSDVNGRFEIEGTFINKIATKLQFRFRVEWLDKSGFRIYDPTQDFETIDVSGPRGVNIKRTSANRDVARWRVRVEPSSQGGPDRADASNPNTNKQH